MKIPLCPWNLLLVVPVLLTLAVLGSVNNDRDRSHCNPDEQRCASREQALLQRKTSKDTALIASTASTYIESGATVHFRTHLYERLTAEPGGAVHAKWSHTGEWQKWVIERADGSSGQILPGDQVYLTAFTGNLLAVNGTEVFAKWKNRGTWESFTVGKNDADALKDGDAVFLQSWTGKHLEANGPDPPDGVQARWADNGQWQSLIVELVPDGGSSDVSLLLERRLAAKQIRSPPVPKRSLLQQKAARSAATPLLSGSIVYLRSHLYERITVQSDGYVHARWSDQGEWQKLTMEKTDGTSGQIMPGDAVYVTGWTGNKIAVQNENSVLANWTNGGTWESFTIAKSDDDETGVSDGDTIYLMTWVGKYLDVNGPDPPDGIQARWGDKGQWQSLVVELVSGPSTTAAPTPTPTPAPTTSGTTAATTMEPSNSIVTTSTASTTPQARSNTTDAQFLIQASFGPTRESLEDLAKFSSYKDWIHAQMEIKGVPLREHFRKKNNPRTYPLDEKIGDPRGKCSGGSRWIGYSISWADRRKSISVSNGKMYIDGVLRTELSSDSAKNGLPTAGGCTDVPSWWWNYNSWSCASKSSSMSWACSSDDFVTNKYCQTTCFTTGYGYTGDDCSSGWASFSYSGYICVVEEKIGGFLKLSTSSSCSSSSTFTHMLNPGIWLPNEANIDASQHFTTLREGVVLLSASSENCGFGDFIRFNGQAYKFDSRLQMVDNTPGSGSGIVTGSCHTVPRAFPKQEGCQLLPSCSSLTFAHASLTLDASTSQLFLEQAERYIYGVSGLRPSASPCGGLSRWKKLDCSSSTCAATSGLSASDLQLIENAITPELGRTIVDIDVDCAAVAAESVVAVSTSYYKHVHLNEMNTYDFTEWVANHPGGETAIKQWATAEKGFVLEFPSWHPMERWNEGSGAEIVGTQYIGAWGDDIDFANLPSVLQTSAVADALGIAATASEYVENCGSPGEIANDPKEGHKFVMISVYEDNSGPQWRDLWIEIPFNFRSDVSWYTPQRSDVWVSRAMFGEDQLRQRVAWALSQIVVASVPGTDYSEYTEMWLAYYDIFMRHAFGNYRDILQEVTYSPLMGEFLTFVDNKAFDVNSRYPDENYAREIQQLFTIGLWKLNSDGSRVVDNGENVPTYSNEDIMTFSRVLTGFVRQAERGNVETVSWTRNLIDPMQMRADYHDGYPKTDLNGDFLGDFMPLCIDRPNKAYLAAGAKYRFVGGSQLTESGLSLQAGSELFTALCGAAAAPCSFKLEVELTTTLTCSGTECDVMDLNVVEVAGGHYQFEPADCVQLFFYIGKIIAHGGDGWWWRRSCANPVTRSAGVACCGGATKDHFCIYPKSYVTLTEATSTCQLQGLELCNTKIVASTECEYDDLTTDRVWTPIDCSGAIEVHPSGKVAWQVDTTTQQNLFPVEWLEGSMPVVTDGACPSGCSTSSDETYCVCVATMSSNTVFTSLPSATDLTSKLKIGAYPPTTSCSQGCSSEVKAYLTGSSFDENTIFEYSGKYYKNQQQTVAVGGAKFRNPPVFMHKMMPSTRGALLEVETMLDHLFTHPNTPVFIGYRLIQRLVTSNPSAAYIEAVGQAFSTGTYDGHTYSGKYGDLAATVAAILLHPEARMQDDAWEGALREPLIKMMHFMRAMEYRDDDGREIGLQGLQDTIAQWPFESPSVFNFYLPGYSPDRFADEYVGPEFEIFTPPMAINLLNGLMKMVDDGFSWCDSWGWNSPNCHNGGLTFPTNDSEVTLNQLDLLLTGGRMTSSKQAVREILEEAATPAAGLKKAQKAMLMVPEFNVMGASMPGDGRATAASETLTEPRSYKATVMLFLHGGADTFNLLVPLNCDLYDEYVSVRQDVALAPESLLSISTSGQTCSEFGIHAGLPILKELYDAGDAAFIANVGGLVEPLTKETYEGSGARCAGLYSHSDQQVAAQTLKCQTRGTSPKGAGGRIADALASSSQSYRTTSFSVAGTAPWPTGFGVKAEILDQNTGVSRLSQYTELQTVIGNITSVTHGNIYCEEYVQAFNDALLTSEQMGEYLEATALQTSMSTSSSLAMQLKQVAHIIATREDRKAERDVFFVSFGSFDTHSSVASALNGLFGSVNTALESFVTELKAQGVFDNTVIVTHSDFGRTLTPNSGLGTDHAWAGNHVVIGGGLNGGKVFNTFPRSLVEGGEQDAGRGRLIPKYPWESVMVPIAEWMGMESGETADVFPNLANFNRSQHIIGTSSLFQSR